VVVHKNGDKVDHRRVIDNLLGKGCHASQVQGDDAVFCVGQMLFAEFLELAVKAAFAGLFEDRIQLFKLVC